jgi:hypothetical protein
VTAVGFGQGTFAGTRGNEQHAPIPDLPALAPEQEGSIQKRSNAPEFCTG